MTTNDLHASVKVELFGRKFEFSDKPINRLVIYGVLALGAVFVLALFASLAALVVYWGLKALGVLALVIVLLVLVDVVMKLLGRNGFAIITKTDTELSVSLDVSTEAFKKRMQ